MAIQPKKIDRSKFSIKATPLKKALDAVDQHFESREDFMEMVKTKDEDNSNRNKVVISMRNDKRRVSETTHRDSCKVDIISYEIKSDDSELVKMIKQEVNHANITLQDIYNSGIFENDGMAYNLYRSLSIHNQISEIRLKLWAGILGKKIIIYMEDDE